MKNGWKGLVVGSLVGLVIGLLLDARAAKHPKTATRRPLSTYVPPETADRLKAVATQGGALLHDAELPDKVRQAAQRFGDADVSAQAKSAVGLAVAKGKDLVGAVQNADVPTRAKGAGRTAAEKAAQRTGRTAP